MKPMISVVAMITVLVTGSAVMTAQAQSRFQKEPVLQAKDLVATELLRGPHYTVDSRVPVKDFLARFTIRSDYGTFNAHGIHMFQIRVQHAGPLSRELGAHHAGDSAGPYPWALRQWQAGASRPRGLCRMDRACRHFAARDDLKAPNRLIWLSGQMDHRAYKAAMDRGWTVYESFTIAAER